MNPSNWIKANTPESAALAALLTDVAGYLTGTLTLHDALIAAMTVLITFVLAEAHVDAAAKAVTDVSLKTVA